eukprot:3555605-Prymnesium_polylepis.1
MPDATSIAVPPEHRKQNACTVIRRSRGAVYACVTGRRSTGVRVVPWVTDGRKFPRGGQLPGIGSEVSTRYGVQSESYGKPTIGGDTGHFQ